MARRFSPPVVRRGPTFLADADATTQRLWGHFRGVAEPTSVLKNGATYVDRTHVYSDDIDAADIFYAGGHIYDVTEAEAAALEAAGYEVMLLSSRFRAAPGTSIDGYTDGWGMTWHGAGIYDPDTSTEGNSVTDLSFTPYIDSLGRVRTPETLVSGSGGAGYEWGYLDQSPSRVGSDTVFATGTSGLAATAVIVSNETDDDSPIPIAFSSVHVVTTGAGVGLFLLDNDTPPFVADAIHLFDDLLTADDVTKHRTDVQVNGDDLLVTCPDGFELEHTHASVSDLWGSTVLFEQLWGPGYGGAEPMTVHAYAAA